MGSSYSAEDIALQCTKYGAGSVTITHRIEPMGFNWPEGIEEVPPFDEGRREHGTFVDGSSSLVDAVVLCTGPCSMWEPPTPATSSWGGCHFPCGRRWLRTSSRGAIGKRP